MTAEKLFREKQGLVPFAIEQKYGSYQKANEIAKKNNMELQDLLQVGFLKLWQLCQQYDPAKDESFNGYVIKTVKWRVQEELHVRGLPIKTTTWCSSERRKQFECLSTDTELQPDDLLPAITDTTSAEDAACRTIEVEEALRGISEKEKAILLLHFSGYQDKEIATLLNYSTRNGASRAKRIAMNKLNPDYEFTTHVVHKKCYKKSRRE